MFGLFLTFSLVFGAGLVYSTDSVFDDRGFLFSYLKRAKDADALLLPTSAPLEGCCGQDRGVDRTATLRGNVPPAPLPPPFLTPSSPQPFLSFFPLLQPDPRQMKLLPYVASYPGDFPCFVLAYRLSAGQGRRIKSLPHTPPPFSHSQTTPPSSQKKTKKATPLRTWSIRATTFSSTTRPDLPFPAFPFFSPIRWS